MWCMRPMTLWRQSWTGSWRHSVAFLQHISTHAAGASHQHCSWLALAACDTFCVVRSCNHLFVLLLANICSRVAFLTSDRTMSPALAQSGSDACCCPCPPCLLPSQLCWPRGLQHTGPFWICGCAPVPGTHHGASRLQALVAAPCARTCAWQCGFGRLRSHAGLPGRQVSW
jgi:hypothetical protein